MTPHAREAIEEQIKNCLDVIESQKDTIELLRSILAGKLDIEPTKLQKTLQKQTLMTAAEWHPDTDWVAEFVAEKWAGVDYRAPMKDFVDYWQAAGVRKTRSSWRSTLRNNPVFRSNMQKMAAAEGIPTKGSVEDATEMARALYRKLKETGRDRFKLGEVEQEPGYSALLNRGGARIEHNEVVLS
jgi:hypothetical protein